MRAKKFLAIMDGCSRQSAKYRRERNLKKLKAIDRTAQKQLLAYGTSLFRILKKVKSRPVKTFEDFFGEIIGDVLLNLDEQTRRFPWELAHDGDDFLCAKYSVGRIAVMPGAERIAGLPPQSRKALVVGLNYRWLPKKNRLHTPEREALQVAMRLKKLRYSPIVLRGFDACKEKIMKILSEGVGVFHFSGHGNYLRNQPEGKRGRLILRDGELNEDELRDCFAKAKGAPYLSFLNAWDSAKEIYNSHLIDAFLDYGAENVVGTMWSVYDDPAREMAVRFYDKAVRQENFGTALLTPRLHFCGSRKQVEAATWPAFVLYGSPSNILPRAP